MADCVVDRLFLGSAYDADNEIYVAKEGFTHVLSVQLGYFPRNHIVNNQMSFLF